MVPEIPHREQFSFTMVSFVSVVKLQNKYESCYIILYKWELSSIYMLLTLDNYSATKSPSHKEHQFKSNSNKIYYNYYHYLVPLCLSGLCIIQVSQMDTGTVWRIKGRKIFCSLLSYPLSWSSGMGEGRVRVDMLNDIVSVFIFGYYDYYFDYIPA